MINVFTLHVCCMNEQESVPLRVMGAAFSLSLFQPVPEAVWDAAWIPVTPDWAQRKALAIDWWGLEYTEIIIPDEPPVPAIGIVHLQWWLDFAVWLLSDAAACGDGCPQLGAWNTTS